MYKRQQEGPAGTALAVAYDFSKIYVTARVDETDINDVRPGQQVDITVDAFSGVTLTGTVRGIQGGAAGVFSLFPQANTSPRAMSWRGCVKT